MAYVLVVDDDGPVRELLSLVVSEAGHTVRQASNGREALALARQEPPNLVISDIMMPLMGGNELLAAMRADPHLRAIPVVLVSAGAGPPAATSLESIVYVRKPFTLEIIELLLRRFLAGPSAPGVPQPSPPD